MAKAREVKLTGPGVEALEKLRGHLAESRGTRLSYSQVITEACVRMLRMLEADNGTGQAGPSTAADQFSQFTKPLEQVSRSGLR